MTGTCASSDNRCYTIYERNYSSISNGPCACSSCLYPVPWLYYPCRAWVTSWLQSKNMDGSTLACRVLKNVLSFIMSLWMFFWEPETFQMHLTTQTQEREAITYQKWVFATYLGLQNTWHIAEAAGWPPTVAFATVSTVALVIMHHLERIKVCYYTLCYTALRTGLQENMCSEAQMPSPLL